ncbi:MAG: hypothetical protein WCB27_07885 [Thermoguttaceae bacterium]|jgi:hypothetical protein
MASKRRGVDLLTYAVAVAALAFFATNGAPMIGLGIAYLVLYCRWINRKIEGDHYEYPRIRIVLTVAAVVVLAVLAVSLFLFTVSDNHTGVPHQDRSPKSSKGPASP